MTVFQMTLASLKLAWVAGLTYVTLCGSEISDYKNDISVHVIITLWMSLLARGYLQLSFKE